MWLPLAAAMKIGYVTDVEGNLEYFRRYLAKSQVLTESAAGELSLVDDTCYFVYGGDVIDKGPGDVRLCRRLVALKRQNPDRVFLLVGNRDLNKLRLPLELESRPRVPHWDPDVVPYDWTPDTRVNRLRWLLKHTLGCPDTFEFRRAELEELGLGSSDDDVVASMVDEVVSGGLREYLEQASVAVRLGCTLFVHGAVDRLSAGFVPPLDTEFRVGRKTDAAFPPTDRLYDTTSVDDWVSALNDVLRKGLRGSPQVLLALQNRCAVWGRSVVSNSFCDGGNVDSPSAVTRRRNVWARKDLLDDARAFEASTGYTSDARDDDVANWLTSHGVRRLVVGHRPAGDSPAVLSAAHHGLEIVCADTSYSDTSAPDNRGSALAALVFEGPSLDSTRTILKGTLKDGRQYSGTLPLLHTHSTHRRDEDADVLIGTVTDDGWWYKARLDDGAYLQSRGDGRRVEYRDSYPN